MLKDAKPMEDKVEVWEWFNAAVKRNSIELFWPDDQETKHNARQDRS